jgi:hypothetical protein
VVKPGTGFAGIRSAGLMRDDPGGGTAWGAAGSIAVVDLPGLGGRGVRMACLAKTAMLLSGSQTWQGLQPGMSEHWRFNEAPSMMLVSIPREHRATFS